MGLVPTSASSAVCHLGADPQRSAYVRQLTGDIGREGSGREGGDDDLHRFPAQDPKIVGGGFDPGPGGGGGDAGCRDLAVGPHQTGAAGTGRADPVVVAERGQIDPGRPHRRKQRGSFGHIDARAVDLDPDHWSHPASRSP